MIFDENNPIKIVMADDHEVVRAGLRRLLSFEKSIRILDEACNGKDAVDLVKYHQPHLVLLDILMPVMTGIEACMIIKRESPDTIVLILTAFEDSNHLEKAIAAGADGYLTKDITSKDLVKAIHTVVLGERVFSKSIILLMQNRFASLENNAEEPVTITKREQSVLNLVATGKKSTEIADELNISVRTVETHRYNVMQKLGVKNVAGLIRYAVLNSAS